MSLRTLSLFLLCSLAALAAAPAVHADTILSPHAGAVFGGDLNDTRGTYGGNLTFLGDGAFGFEIEGAYTPDFFGDNPAFTDNNVSSLMANILLGSGFGDRGKVYAALGGGLLKTRVGTVDEFFDVDNTDFGVSAGVGAIGYVSDHVGLRGDVRYFRNLGDDEPDNEFDINFGDFSFWRATAGVAFRF